MMDWPKEDRSGTPDRLTRNESAGKPQVCFFWDIENVHVPGNLNAKTVAMKLRNTFVRNGFSEYDFYAACDCKRERKALLDALNDAEVSVLHTDGFKKNSADSKLRSKMRRTASKMKEGDKIVLITSDNDFAPEVREIRYTHLLTMVLIHNPVVSSALIHFTHEHYCFLDLVKDILVENDGLGVNAKSFPQISESAKVNSNIAAADAKVALPAVEVAVIQTSSPPAQNMSPVKILKRIQSDAPSSTVDFPDQCDGKNHLLPNVAVNKPENQVGNATSSSKVTDASENRSLPSKLPAPQDDQPRFVFVPVTDEDRTRSLSNKKIKEVMSSLVELLQCAILQHQTLPRDYRQLIKLYNDVVRERTQIVRSSEAVHAEGGDDTELTVYDRQRILMRLAMQKMLQFDIPPDQCLIGFVLTDLNETRLAAVSQQISRAQLNNMAVCKQRKHFDAARRLLVATFQEYVDNMQQLRPNSSVDWIAVEEKEALSLNAPMAEGTPTFMFFSELYVKFTEAAAKHEPLVQCLSNLSPELFTDMLSKEFADLVDIRYRAEDAHLKFDIKAVMAFEASRNQTAGSVASSNAGPKSAAAPASVSIERKNKKKPAVSSPPSMSGGKMSSAQTSTTELLRNAARQLASGVTTSAKSAVAVNLSQPVSVPRSPLAKAKSRTGAVAAGAVQMNGATRPSSSVISEEKRQSAAVLSDEFILEAEAYKLLPYPLLKDFKLRLCTNLANRVDHSITLRLFHRQFVSLPRRVQLFRVNTIETIARIVARQCNDVVSIDRTATGDTLNPTYRLQSNWKDNVYRFADDWEERMTNDWEWARRLQQRLFVKLEAQPKRRATLGALVEFFASHAKRVAENPIQSVADMEMILTRYFTDTVMLKRNVKDNAAVVPASSSTAAAVDENTTVVLLSGARQWPFYDPLKHSHTRYGPRPTNSCALSPSSSGSPFRTPSLVLSSSTSSISLDFVAGTFSPPPPNLIAEQDLLKCLQEQHSDQTSSSAWKKMDEHPKFVPFDEIVSQQEQFRHSSVESNASTATLQPPAAVKAIRAPPPLPSAPKATLEPQNQQWWHSRLGNPTCDYYRGLQQRIYTFLYNETVLHHRRVTLVKLFEMWRSKPSRLQEYPFKNAAHMQSILVRYFADSFVVKHIVNAEVREGRGGNAGSVVVEIAPAARQQQVKRGVNGSSVSEAAPETEAAVVKGLSFAERAYASRILHASRNNCTTGADAFDVAGSFQYYDGVPSVSSSEGSKFAVGNDRELRKPWESVFFDKPAMNGFISAESQQINTSDENERTPRKSVRAHRRLNYDYSQDLLATESTTAAAPIEQLPMPLISPARGPLIDFTESDGEKSTGAAVASTSLFGESTLFPDDGSSNLALLNGNVAFPMGEEPRSRWFSSGLRPANQSQVSIDLEQEMAERFSSIMRDVDF